MGLELDVALPLGPGSGLEVQLRAGAGALALVGPNGAGKSTLLHAILGLRRPLRGRIVVAGEVLFDAAAKVDVPVEARRIGWVPQDYALFPHLSVRANVAFARHGLPRARRRAHGERVEALIEGLGLGPLADRRPESLSGGERQRVALARALAIEPRALLLDEPLAALDVHARAEVRALLSAQLAQLAVPCVVVTHDALDARALGASIAVLEAGRVTQHGTWEDLRGAPATPFVAELTEARSTPLMAELTGTPAPPR